jgi:DNA-binding transcriptional LysR family regulator
MLTSKFTINSHEKILEQLFLFIDVAEFSNLTAAAAKNNCSTSKMSRMISAIESSLGIILFKKQGALMQLTEEGKLFYRSSKEIINKFNTTIEDISDMRINGTLRIQVNSIYLMEQLGTIIPYYKKAHPQVSLSIFYDEGLTRAISQQYDVKICCQYTIGDCWDKFRLLGGLDMVLCASGDYIAKNGALQSQEQLATHPCIVLNTFDPKNPRNKWLFEQEGGIHATKLNAIIEAPSLQMHLSMAQASQGIAKLPLKMVAKHFESGELVQVLPQCIIPQTKIYAVYHNQSNIPQKISSFVDFLIGKKEWLQRS